MRFFVGVFIALSQFVSFSTARAEYRAFVLRIEKVENPLEYREITSNLDPKQYTGYYPIGRDERIYYTDTWMCPGRTYGFAKICDKPTPPAVE